MRRAPTAPEALERSGSGAWSTTSGDYSSAVHGSLRKEPSAPSPLNRSVSAAWSTTSSDYSPRASASRGELGAAFSPRGKKSHPDHLKSNRWIVTMPSLLQQDRSSSRFAPVDVPEHPAGASSQQTVAHGGHFSMMRAGRGSGTESMSSIFDGDSGMDRKSRGDSCPPPVSDPIAWSMSPLPQSPRAMRRLGYEHSKQTWSLAGAESSIVPLPMREALHVKKGFEDVYKPRAHNRRNSLRTHFLAGHEDMFTPKPRLVIGPDLEASAGHVLENDRRLLRSPDRVVTPRVNRQTQSSSDLPLSIPKNCANAASAAEESCAEAANFDVHQELSALRRTDPPTPGRQSRSLSSLGSPASGSKSQPSAARSAARSGLLPTTPGAQTPKPSTPARTPLRLFRDPLAA